MSSLNCNPSFKQISLDGTILTLSLKNKHDNHKKHFYTGVEKTLGFNDLISTT